MRKALAALKKFDRDVQKAATGVLAEAGREILAGAKSRVPVDSGELSASLGMEVQNNGWRVVNYADAPHAPFQEFGTGRKNVETIVSVYPPEVGKYAYDTFFKTGEGNTKGQPFLFPPFLAVREEVPKRVEAAIKKVADEFNRLK